jgi:membrane protein DedA with SNARE-associated domain
VRGAAHDDRDHAPRHRRAMTFLTHYHGVTVYLVVAGLVIAESGFVIGFFVPGEIAVVLGGVLANEHRVNLVVMLVVANAAAIGAFFIGYAVGSLIGPWLLERRLLRSNPAVERTRQLLARRGGPAVLVGRFVAVVRAILPALAGLSDIPFRTFVPYNVVGGLVWATLYTLVGYAVGKSYKHLLSTIGVWSYVVVGAVVVALVVNHFRLRRQHRRAAVEQPGPSAE